MEPRFRVPPAQTSATDRWSAASRLVLVILAALAVDWLLLRPKRLTVAVVVVRNGSLLVSEYRDPYLSRTARDAAIVGFLRAATRRGEIAFFSPSGWPASRG
jgi:hypothetical protein